MEFLAEALKNGVNTVQLTLLGGQRDIFWSHESGEIDKHIDIIDKSTGEISPWVRVLKEGDRKLETETDLLRLATEIHLGTTTLRRIALRFNNADLIARYDFDYGDIPLSISHTLAVARANGEPRHTTEACIDDWLSYRQPKHGARVAFIAANPHIRRTVHSAGVILSARGRSDVELFAAGPAAGQNNDHPIYLGEIARNLYEDQRPLK
jgi:hypothetical protein